MSTWYASFGFYFFGKTVGYILMLQGLLGERTILLHKPLCFSSALKEVAR